MITCLNFDYLPPLECQPAPLPTTQDPTLTELVCLAIYGAPLKPGDGKGTLAEHLKPLMAESNSLWLVNDGPFWLKPHLERIAEGKSCLVDKVDEEGQRIEYAAAQDWLARGRKLPAPEGAAPSVVANKERLARKSDAEAIQFVNEECARIQRENRAVGQQIARFYELISEAAITGKIELTAIVVDPEVEHRRKSRQRRRQHLPIGKNFLNVRLQHYLLTNEIHVGMPEAGLQSMETDPQQGSPVRLEHVRVRLQDVNWLVTEFNHRCSSPVFETGATDGVRSQLFMRVKVGELSPEAAEAEAHRLGLAPLNPGPDRAAYDPMDEVSWTFAMALAWIVWRDPDQVRMQWDKWRSEVREWHEETTPEVGAGGETRVIHGIYLMPLRQQHGSFSDVSLDAAVRAAAGNSPVLSPDDARTALWRALQEGKLDPDGIDPQTGSRIRIDRRQFVDLDIRSSTNGDYLGAGLGQLVYQRPSLRRAEVVDTFPREQSEPKPTSETRVNSVVHRGRPVDYDRETLTNLLNDLFARHGALSSDDAEWNSNAKVESALAEIYQSKYRKAKAPARTTLQSVVKEYLLENPEWDNRKQRRQKAKN